MYLCNSNCIFCLSFRQEKNCDICLVMCSNTLWNIFFFYCFFLQQCIGEFYDSMIQYVWFHFDPSQDSKYTQIYATHYWGNAFLHSLSEILNWGKGLDLMPSSITWLFLNHFELWILGRYIGIFPSLGQMGVTFSLSRTQFDLSQSFSYLF